MRLLSDDSGLFRLDHVPSRRTGGDMSRIEESNERHGEEAAVRRQLLEMILRNEAVRRNRPR